MQGWYEQYGMDFRQIFAKVASGIQGFAFDGLLVKALTKINRLRMNNFYKNRNKQFARGRTDAVTGMNGLEKKYAGHLRTLQLAGEIHSFAFERHNLKLADRTYYKPDFEVMLPDGTIEFHEVKGFMMDDANVKIKVAAAQFSQYVFRLVQWDRKTGWKIKPYPPHNK